MITRAEREPRDYVAASRAMFELRQMQRQLNDFWQTSELSYGYLLNAGLGRDPERRAVDLLGHVESAVWYPNREGRIKREDTIGKTLAQVEANTVVTYRTTLLSFYAAFEAYLKAAVGNRRRGGTWGPLVFSLTGPALRDAPCPLPLRIILCADFCRRLRNAITHDGFVVPASVNDPEFQTWQQDLTAAAIEAGWPEGEIAAEIPIAARRVVGAAAGEVAKAMKREQKRLPIELFYMLFTFSNLDALALALEEALLPTGSRTGYEVVRRRADIRRPDLILGAGERPPRPPPSQPVPPSL
jgi:hypothetical protein